MDYPNIEGDHIDVRRYQNLMKQVNERSWERKLDLIYESWIVVKIQSDFRKDFLN